MFKWPWKADDESGNAEMPWEQALAIPVLAHLSSTEQHKLTQMAARFLQQKRLVALQGLEPAASGAHCYALLSAGA